MDRFLRDVFRGEIETQCEMIVAADTDLWLALERGASHDAWRHLQTILVSSANVYKMLWGSGGQRENERRPLRELLAVPDDSILRDPSLRNDFEHFDERLEGWYGQATTRIYVGRNVGNPAALQGLAGEYRFSHFDPLSGVVSFWDNAVNVRDLVAEAKRILALPPRKRRGMAIDIS